MKINAIQTAAVSVKSNAYNNATVPTSLQPQTAPKEEAKQKDNSPTALMNYFLGSQNVPSFKGHPCSTGGFAVKQIENVPCACCGDEMMNAKEQNAFTAVATKAKGQELADVFSANLQKIRRNERPVAREIMERATKYPEDSLSKLVDREDMNPGLLFTKENKIVLGQVDKVAQELYGEENKVSKFVKAQKPSTIERNHFLDDLKELTKADTEKSQKVLAAAIELPLSQSGVSKVISKVQSSDATGIARRLIATAVMTTEHIHPKSQGGPNNTENYMGECAECNNNRGSQNLNQYWQTVYPNMPSAVQKYADFITEKIVKGEMGIKYEDHMLDLEKAVETESQGAIDVKVLNPEEIDKMRKAKGYADPKPLPEPVYPDKPEGNKKPSGSKGPKKPHRKPSRG